MCMGMMNYRKPKEEKKVSLLKPYTNFDRMKDASIDELAYMLMCPYDKDFNTDDFCIHKKCVDCTKQWLVSEVTE